MKLDKRIIRQITGLLLVLILAGCSSKELNNNQVIRTTEHQNLQVNNDTNERQVLLTIDNQSVYLNEVLVYLSHVEQEFESIGGLDIWETDFDGKTAEQLAKERAIENIVKTKILSQKAVALGIQVTPEEKEQINNQVKVDLAYLLKDELKDNISEEMMEKLYSENMLARKVFEEMTKDFEVDQVKIDLAVEEDSRYQFYLGADLNELFTQVRAKHILFRTHDLNESKQLIPLSQEEQEKAYIKAEEALQRIMQGEDFVMLVHEYSEDEASLKSDGEYVFPRGYMVPEFEEVAFSLLPGEVSTIVQTNYGYHIIKVEERIIPSEEEKQSFLESLEAEIRSAYIESQKLEAFNKQYEVWKETYSISISQELWNSVNIGLNQ